MNGLYKRVLKGSYQEIPKKYTKDLSDTIMRMLSVEPKLRPSCAQLLELPQVRKRVAKLFPEDDQYSSYMESREPTIYEDDPSTNHNELLNTIKVPNNLAQLTKRLPKSNYSK